MPQCLLPPAPESVSAARRFVVESLSGMSQETLDNAALVVSELATNCVLHAGGDFLITVTASRTEIRIEVTDSGAGTVQIQHPSPDEAHGRGLQIVNALSRDWGIQPARRGKTIWFTLPV
jgi:anti-sigma regulatory factor (Ser/Thr protein kinase)